MYSLPPLVLDEVVFRLPLFAPTAVELSGLFVDPGSTSGDRLCRLLASDPALVLWVQCQSKRCGNDRLDSWSATADWLARHARRIFASGPAGDELTESAASQAGSLRDASLRVTRGLASCKAGSSNGSTAPRQDSGSLVGLLHNARQWLELAADGEISEIQVRSLLPEWLAEQVSMLENEANETNKGILTANPGSADLGVDDRMSMQSTPVASDPVPWLGTLARRMERLSDLEEQFAAILEREKLEALAEFAAGAGHEINNPLAVISGRAQLLLAAERHPERRHDLALIDAQARRIGEMILDLMLFARPPAPRLSRIDLRDILEELGHRLAEQLAERQIELKCAVEDQPLLLEADADQITVALRALLDNAAQAIGRNGRIELTAVVVPSSGATCPRIVVTVADTGCGISAEVRRHLFDPFYSGRAAGRGLGMGLAKCWRIITLHGGTMEVADRAGSGAALMIGLPAVDCRCASDFPAGSAAQL
jgi:signal transduction histidine kinase